MIDPVLSKFRFNPLIICLPYHIIFYLHQIICKIIRKLKMNSAAGPDRLPPIFYRQTEVSITNPLSILYRTIIDLHTLPT